MEYKRYIQLITEPARSGTESVNSLQELVNEFPYFQSAHMLLAYAMKEQQHIRFEKQLKLAAAYSPDRKVLFSLLHDKKKLSESFAEKLAEEVVSPFIMEDTKQIETSENLIPDQELLENPFIQAKIGQSTFVQEKPIQEEKFNEEKFNEEAKPELVYEPQYAKDAEEFVSMETSVPLSSSQQLSAEPLSTDPREVLRRRLAEILGNPSEAEPTSTSEPLSISEKFETKNESFQIKPSVPESSASEVKEENTPETIKESEEGDHLNLPSATLLDTLSNIPEPPIAEPEAVDSLKELLPEDSSKPMDAIEKLGLEYAMEESLLSSLENLPPIEPEIINVKEGYTSKTADVEERQSNLPIDEPSVGSSQPRSFSSWLKKLSGGEFGKVEEVHADDKAEVKKAEEIMSEPRREPTPSTHTGTAEASPSQAELRKPEPSSHSLSGFDAQKKVLIDKFIETEPKIVPSKVEFYSPVTQAKRSIEEYDDVVSETLANIYRQQGNRLKARFCYEKLSLFYPEKRTYFAALIKEIDEELNSSNQEDL